MTLLAQTTEIIDAIDHAAQKDMRWWFLGLLIIGLIVAYGMARVGLSLIDKQGARLDQVQDENNKYLRESNGKLVAAVEKHAEAMEQFSRVMEPISRTLK